MPQYFHCPYGADEVMARVTIPALESTLTADQRYGRRYRLRQRRAGFILSTRETRRGFNPEYADAYLDLVCKIKPDAGGSVLKVSFALRHAYISLYVLVNLILWPLAIYGRSVFLNTGVSGWMMAFMLFCIVLSVKADIMQKRDNEQLLVFALTQLLDLRPVYKA